MSVKKTYVNYPLEKGDPVRGLTETQSLKELKNLYSVKALDNKILNIPAKNSSKFPKNLPTTEVKNLFQENAGKQIVFISDLFNQFEEVSIP